MKKILVVDDESDICLTWHWRSLKVFELWKNGKDRTDRWFIRRPVSIDCLVKRISSE